MWLVLPGFHGKGPGPLGPWARTNRLKFWALKLFLFLFFLCGRQVFGDIMIDYSYVECSASAMQALGMELQELPPVLGPNEGIRWNAWRRLLGPG